MFDFSNTIIDKEKLNKILDLYSTVRDDIETSGVWIGGIFYSFCELFEIDSIDNDHLIPVSVH